MASLTDFEVDYDSEPLTPIHSIPTNINSSDVSGSKGRFSECFSYISEPDSPFEVKASRIHTISFKSPEAEILKFSPKKPLSSEIHTIPSEPFKNIDQFSRRLTKEDSLDLIGRLDDELGRMKTRIGSFKGLKDTGVKVEKRSPSMQGDVVSRLLKYGEITKKKNDERIRVKKEREEAEASQFTQKPRGKSDAGTHYRSAKALVISPTPKQFTPVSSNLSSAKNSNRALSSSNSPDKIIEKMKKLVKSSKS